MKIIIIPYYPEISGRHYCIAKTLVEQGHDVHYVMSALPYGISFKELLLNLTTSVIAQKYSYDKFTMHKVSRLPYFWPVINGLLFRHQIRKLFKMLNADIIFTETFTNETEVPKDLPFIYDLADDYAAPAEVYGSPIYKLAFKFLGVKNVMRRQCENALSVTAVSENLYKYARQYNKSVFKLPNGVDKKIIIEAKKSKRTSSKNKFSFVYVSAFNQWYRPIKAMEAVVELRKKFPSIELTLIGKGNETQKIKEFIKDNKAKNFIHYLGFVDNRKKLFNLINQNEIGLNLSVKNKFRDAAHPIKVLEYSALGKKVVSTDLDEVKKLNFPNIFLFTDKKKNNLIDVMEKVLIDNRSETHFKKTSNYVLKMYSWEKVTSDLVNIFKYTININNL